MTDTCPLCRNKDVVEYHEDRSRKYLFCNRCNLVFVPPRYHLSPEEEKREYDLHENDPFDPGYRRFLSRLCSPLLDRLGEKKKGLDFGCGPGPALARMLEEKGHIMSLYDIFFYDNKDVFQEKYDFISSTEVLEHLKDPAFEIDRLIQMLEPDGWLAVMTKLVIDREAFSKWHYIQDRTHICFYRKETFQFLADQYNCELLFIDRDVVFLRKRNPYFFQYLCSR